jgi:uncharacterized protein (TIGR02145 family)
MGNKIFSFILIFGMLMILTSSCKKDEAPSEPVTDAEGNIYKTVKIGEQIWMDENLKTTKYNDGKEIPEITDGTMWAGLKAGAYCWYQNDQSSNKETYGAIYNGYAVSTGNLCPAGWHVPELTDWQMLREFSGDTIYGGGKLKEAGTIHWLTPNKGADNSSGFTALPAGIRYFEGTFVSVSQFTGIWSATAIGTKDQWLISLYYGDAVFNIIHRTKNHGFSVRCIKD